jgi:TetR/AcrR family transcriptional repressor of nem operon
VDVARAPKDAAAREAYARGVEMYADRLGPDGLAELSTMVGAMILARATAGTELSERILAEAKAAVSGRGATSAHRWIGSFSRFSGG